MFLISDGRQQTILFMIQLNSNRANIEWGIIIETQVNKSLNICIGCCSCQTETIFIEEGPF